MQQMMPLILDLACGNGEGYFGQYGADLARIEGISTFYRLGMNPPQIRIDGGKRVCAIAKTLELGMVAIAACIAAQNRARQ